MKGNARRPIHLAVLVGASTGAYVLSLAGVTALQSETDARLVDARAPVDQAAKRLSDDHDALEARLARSSSAYATSAGGYRHLTTDIGDLEVALEDLAGRVTKVSGAAAALPGRVSLPSVTVSTPTIKRPAVHATTAAS